MIIYLKLILTAIFWGGTFIAGRIVARNVDPFSASFLRFVLASLFLIVFVRKNEGRLPKIKKSQIMPVALLGTTGIFLYNVFFFKGLKLIEAGRAAIIIANNPTCIALLSAYLFKEKLSLLKIIGIILSVSGAFIVISKGDWFAIIEGGLGRGELYIFICVLSWVAFSLIGRTVLKGMSPLVAIAYSSLVGAGLLFFPAYASGLMIHLFSYTLTDWLGIFYLGFFGTVIGFVWYYDGIQKIGPMKASIFINFVPISAVILAFIILNEPLTLSLLVGTILVSCGVYLANATFSSSN